MIPGRIETTRLVLRPIVPGDAPAIAEGVGDWDVARWLVPVPHPYTIEDAEAFVTLAGPGGSLEAEGERTWAVSGGGRLVGLVGFGVGPGQELGYWLGREAWGQGYATEAARAVLAAHFAGPAAGDVTSGFFDGNERSERVLRRLGFAEVGVHLRPCLARGEDVPSHRMRLTRAAWEAASRA